MAAQIGQSDGPSTQVSVLRARFATYVEDESSPDFCHAEALVAWCLVVRNDCILVEARANILALLAAGADRFLPAAELISLAEPFAAFTEGRTPEFAQRGIAP